MLQVHGVEDAEPVPIEEIQQAVEQEAAEVPRPVRAPKAARPNQPISHAVLPALPELPIALALPPNNPASVLGNPERMAAISQAAAAAATSARLSVQYQSPQ